MIDYDMNIAIVLMIAYAALSFKRLFHTRATPRSLNETETETDWSKTNQAGYLERIISKDHLDHEICM